MKGWQGRVIEIFIHNVPLFQQIMLDTLEQLLAVINRHPPPPFFCGISVRTYVYIDISLLFMFSRWAECAVGIVFIILILLWFLRDPQFIEGWSIAFKDG